MATGGLRQGRMYLPKIALPWSAEGVGKALGTHGILSTLDKDHEHCTSDWGASHWHNRHALLYPEIPGQNWLSGDQRNVSPWLTLATEPRGRRGSAAQPGPALPTQHTWPKHLRKFSSVQLRVRKTAFAKAMFTITITVLDWLHEIHDSGNFPAP